MKTFKELFIDNLSEAKMSDEEVLATAEQLAKNGDDKAKEFANGLISYYKENNAFHPNQVSGLQNIMKNASFQLAEASNDVILIADKIKNYEEIVSWLKDEENKGISGIKKIKKIIDIKDVIIEVKDNSVWCSFNTNDFGKFTDKGNPNKIEMNNIKEFDIFHYFGAASNGYTASFRVK